MKSGIKLVAAASAMMAAGAAQAQTRGGLEVGVQLYGYEYRERVERQVVAQDDGLFYGLELSYTQPIGSNLFVRGRLEAAVGSVDYEGGTVFGEPGETPRRLENVRQAVAQAEIHLGYDIVAGTSTITPFAGLGGRALSDSGGGRSTPDGVLGYDREVGYSYVPLGLAFRQEVGGGSSITLSAQYNWLVGGEATSFFSKLDAELPDVRVALNEGHGFELSAMIEVPVGRRAARITPFWRRWSIDQSESFVIVNPDDPTEAIELVEPPSRTTEIGIRLSFAF